MATEVHHVLSITIFIDEDDIRVYLIPNNEKKIPYLLQQAISYAVVNNGELTAKDNDDCYSRSMWLVWQDIVGNNISDENEEDLKAYRRVARKPFRPAKYYHFMECYRYDSCNITNDIKAKLYPKASNVVIDNVYSFYCL